MAEVPALLAVDQRLVRDLLLPARGEQHMTKRLGVLRTRTARSPAAVRTPPRLPGHPARARTGRRLAGGPAGVAAVEHGDHMRAARRDLVQQRPEFGVLERLTTRVQAVGADERL